MRVLSENGVLERLADPSDLEMFVRAVNTWLESGSG